MPSYRLQELFHDLREGVPRLAVDEELTDPGGMQHTEALDASIMPSVDDNLDTHRHSLPLLAQVEPSGDNSTNFDETIQAGSKNIRVRAMLSSASNWAVQAVDADGNPVGLGSYAYVERNGATLSEVTGADYFDWTGDPNRTIDLDFVLHLNTGAVDVSYSDRTKMGSNHHASISFRAFPQDGYIDSTAGWQGIRVFAHDGTGTVTSGDGLVRIFEDRPIKPETGQYEVKQ